MTSFDKASGEVVTSARLQGLAGPNLRKILVRGHRYGGNFYPDGKRFALSAAPAQVRTH